MKISTRFFLFMGFFFLVVGTSIIIIVNMYMRYNALHEADRQAGVILENMVAIQTYFSHQLKLSLFNLTEKYSEEFFDPKWMSSSYALRQILKYAQSFKNGDFYYKECAIDARSPDNEANEYEADFLNEMKKNPELVNHSDIKTINGRTYFVVLRRGTTPNESCLRCHGDPADAPKVLIELYGAKRSFNQSLEDLIYAISIRIPLDHAYATANRFSVQLSGILLFILFLLFLVQHLVIKKWFFNPLQQLHEKAQLIATNRHHLGEQLPVPKGKELETLTISFNTMSKSLCYHVDNLDKLVEERTLKISESNKQLANEIEERTVVEQEMQKNADRYKGIFENTKNGIAVYRAINDGEDFIFIEFNRGGEKLEQLNRNDLIGRRVSEVFPDVKKFGLFDVFQRVWKTGEPEYFPLGFYQDQRISGWRENYVYKLPSGEIVAIYSDETKRKQAEEFLSLEKERLFVTLRSIGDGVISTDQNGNIVLINQLAEELTGWKQAEVLGKPISKAFHIINEKTRKTCENPVKKVLQAGVTVGLANHTVLISRDGTERRISDSGAPIFNAEKKIIGAVLVFRDVTEKFKMEQQLQQRQKMEAIGTLAGGIAHDFNNMLGVIIGNISYISSLFNQDDELFHVLSEIQEGAQKAQSLTHQLLTFSDGGAPIKKTSDIKQLIIESAEFVLRGTPIKCQFDFPDDLWPAEIDSGQINQAINNIVINAIHAMPDGGTIHIQAKNLLIDDSNAFHFSLSPGRYVKINLKDQGSGIAEQYLTKIFDPYFTTKQKGSGLGLASTYSIIKQHNGHISVQSQLNNGTCFSIYLPASVNHVETDKKETASSHTGHGRVLIMDDDESILKMSGRIFNRLGYDTAFATDGSQAIEMYQQALTSSYPFTLVVLDLTVAGGMGGAKTIPELLKIDPRVKAIVSSGYSTDPIMSNFQDYGFSAVLPKPYTKNQLAEVLDTVYLS
ncbi:MAG: DUF3365 domain-containing protein [Candidatus Magnetomorum sp.]|nr:DUF3365 domain-containing protein [Candidatus Magnetomorum sp.]